MKAILTLVTFISLLGSARAQVMDSTFSKNNFYVGLGFSTLSYHIYYKEPKEGEEHASAYFAPLSINFGYKWKERTSIQAGIAYGGSSDHFNWSPGSKDTLLYDTHGKTHVVAIPVTMRYIFMKIHRRIPIYGTATVMPAYGITKTSITEIHNNVTTTQVTSDSGVNIFFTAGIGLEYKISKRFNGFFEYHAYKHNLTGKNSVFYDWDHGARGVYRFIRTIGFGLNYNL